MKKNGEVFFLMHSIPKEIKKIKVIFKIAEADPNVK